MQQCKKCRCELVQSEYELGICYKCAQSPEFRQEVEDEARRQLEAKLERADKVVITTEAMPAGLVINRRLGIITAQASEGMNILQDVISGINDVIGGAVPVVEGAYDRCATRAIARLNVKAAEMDADAVIGVSVNYGELTGKNTKSLIVSVTGTAVKLADA